MPVGERGGISPCAGLTLIGLKLVDNGFVFVYYQLCMGWVGKNISFTSD
jgi:hypothetical protein